MANYSTNLKTWGDKGTEYPDGYDQQDGVPPVDAWHDFLFYNQIEDIQHLISLTNDRLESDIGTSYVSSPEDGHNMYRTDKETFEVYNSSAGAWQDLAWGADLRNHEQTTTNPHNVSLEQARTQNNSVSGNIDVGGNHILGLASTESVHDGTRVRFLSSDPRLNLQVGDGAGNIVNALQASSNGNIEIPNGNITWPNGTLNFSDGDGLTINTPGGGSGKVEIWDAYNNQMVFQAYEGANVRIPNGSITQGKDPADTITETTSPKSFNFNGGEHRDVHEKTDVTISNGSSSSVTEDVTVELYDGSDTTGTLLQSETKSVSVSSGSSKVVTFVGIREELDTGTYHIEITTSGTTLAVDQTDEYTRGGKYTFDQNVYGELKISDQYGNQRINIDPVTDVVRVTNSILNINDGHIYANGKNRNKVGEFESTDSLSLAGFKDNNTTGDSVRIGAQGDDLVAYSGNGTKLFEGLNTGNLNLLGNLQIGGSIISKGITASGQVQLSSGSAIVNTGISATDATFQLALGIDDPNADCKISGRLFWDDSAGTYKVEIKETETRIGNPTVNYDVVRVR